MKQIYLLQLSYLAFSNSQCQNTKQKLGFLKVRKMESDKRTFEKWTAAHTYIVLLKDYG